MAIHGRPQSASLALPNCFDQQYRRAKNQPCDERESDNRYRDVMAAHLLQPSIRATKKNDCASQYWTSYQDCNEE